MNRLSTQRQHEESPLIVDFPSRPRFGRDGDNDDALLTGAYIHRERTVRRAVCFSECSQMVIIETEEADHRTIWYTPEEKGPIKRQLMKDARRMGRVLAAARAAGVTVPESELCKCVGIEHLLSLEKARRTMQLRRDHIRRVVSRQHTASPEQLGLISQDSSEQARSRASSLAAGYWKMMS